MMQLSTPAARACVRMALGLKGVEHDLAFLSNDDVETPSSMIGKKMVPILELGRPRSESHEVRGPRECWKHLERTEG